MPFAFAYVLVIRHCIGKHRIRFKLVLFGKGVWRCLESIGLKQHEFYAFSITKTIIISFWELWLTNKKEKRTIGMKFYLPIPFNHIALWPDTKIVPSLLRYEELPTAEYFYGKTYPIFKSLYDRYTSDGLTILDFIHDIYVDIMRPRSVSKKCKLETFNYKCALHNWIKVVAIKYCYAMYNKNIPTESLPDGDRNQSQEPSILINMSKMDRADVETILEMMPNKRFSELIRYRYLEEYDNVETAKKLGMTMDNYYNKHRLAKVQYLQVFTKEMSR